MENQTRFDLNAAIENWRNELAAQPNLASDDRRELETHLRDAIAGFQQRGLNDEESFWLARRRVGQPPKLGEEFVKADPAKFGANESLLDGLLWDYFNLEYRCVLICGEQLQLPELWCFPFSMHWLERHAWFCCFTLWLTLLPIIVFAIVSHTMVESIV